MGRARLPYHEIPPMAPQRRPRGLSVGSTSRSLSGLNGVLLLAALTQLVWLPVFLVDGLPRSVFAPTLAPPEGTPPVSKLAAILKPATPQVLPDRDPLLAPLSSASDDREGDGQLLPRRLALSPAARAWAPPPAAAALAVVPAAGTYGDVVAPPKPDGAGDVVARATPDLSEMASPVHRPLPAVSPAMALPPADR